jgi:hypothetical protein
MLRAPRAVLALNLVEPRRFFAPGKMESVMAMSNYHTDYMNLLIQEIEATPDEHLPNLLKNIRLFRESITLKPAESSFRQGWKEAMRGETLPIDDLWTGIDDE